MDTKSAKNKGRELENFVVRKLRESGLDTRASRNPGSGSGNQKGDVWNSLGVCIECKNTRKAPGKAEFEQVAREAMGYSTEVLIWHAPQTAMEASKVILNIDDWIELMKKSKEQKTVSEPTKELKWKLMNLLKFTKEVLKELEE